MDSEDGQIFVKNLANFVRTHERALANALHLQLQRSKNGNPNNTATASSGNASTSTSLTRSYLPFSSGPNIKSAKLTLTPHHLFYLLSKFEDLGVDIGPMNVRLENLQHDAGFSNYVSFMGKAPKSKGKQADTESLRSVSSMRSVVSSMSSLWSNLTLAHATAKAEKRQTQYREDIRYLYSCFTKIPALKLAPDHRARLVSGYEEFPFDTAVPLFAFKNVSALEVCDIDFRQFHGWDRLSEQLRSLTVKRANVDDPIDLLQHIVLDDIEKRRRRSFKTPVPTTPSTPGAPWPNSSPKGRQIDLARTMSAPSPPLQEPRRPSTYGSPYGTALLRGDPFDPKAAAAQSWQRSSSPPRPISSRQGSLTKPVRTASAQNRRSSGSSGTSSAQDNMTPRHSSTDLVTMNILPSSKWRFLRHLSLAENGLTYLSVPSLAPVAGTLQSLDLSGNLFSEVPDALSSLTHLRALNLSNCMIDSLKSLSRSPLPAITVLNLRSNRLLNLAGIERLFSLERLDLRDNKLHDPTELSRLTSTPDIIDVFVLKNPFTRTHGNYRVTIFNLFRSTPGRIQDLALDMLPPTSAEKKLLADWAPEKANVPIIRPPPPNDDDDVVENGLITAGPAHSTTTTISTAVPTGAPTEADLHDLAPRQFSSYGPSDRGHRRTTSDSGPEMSRKSKKRKPPRRRIVELSQAAEAETGTFSSTVGMSTSPPQQKSMAKLMQENDEPVPIGRQATGLLDPDATDHGPNDPSSVPEVDSRLPHCESDVARPSDGPRTPSSETEQPVTPVDTPLHDPDTDPTSPGSRDGHLPLQAAIRDPEAEVEVEDVEGDEELLYRRKIQGLKSGLGPTTATANWAKSEVERGLEREGRNGETVGVGGIEYGGRRLG